MLLVGSHGGSVVTGGEDTSDSGGTAITAGNGSEGTAVSFIDPMPFEGGLVSVMQCGMSSFECLVDVLVEDASGGNAQVLIPDLLFQKVGNNDASSISCYHVPIRVPKGTRLSCRALGSAASTIDLIVNVQSVSLWPTPFTKCLAYGAGGAASGRGTQIDPGTTANTLGYTQVVASSTIAHRAFFLGVGRGFSGSWVNGAQHARIVVGGSGQKRPASPWMGWHMGSTEDLSGFVAFPWLANVPAASEIGLETRSSLTSSQTYDAIIYGLS